MAIQEVFDSDPQYTEKERMAILYEGIIRNAAPSEGARLNVAYAIARHLGLECPAAKVIVPATVSADFANEHFGENYGRDWEYESA